MAAGDHVTIFYHLDDYFIIRTSSLTPIEYSQLGVLSIKSQTGNV